MKPAIDRAVLSQAEEAAATTETDVDIVSSRRFEVGRLPRSGRLGRFTRGNNEVRWSWRVNRCAGLCYDGRHG